MEDSFKILYNYNFDNDSNFILRLDSHFESNSSTVELERQLQWKEIGLKEDFNTTIIELKASFSIETYEK